jgi:glyoxylate/hydroxypyruvate reductase A
MPDEAIIAGAAFASSGIDPTTVEIAIAANPKPEALAPFTSLGFVQSLWAGVEHLVHNPALPPAVPLARLVDPNMAQYMAEAVLAHVMALHRDHALYDCAQRRGHWAPAPVRYAVERTVGFLGTGELARACMAMLQPIGFPVMGWSRAPREIEGVRTFTGAAGLDEMLAQTDVLVNLLPLTAATRGIIDGRLLSKLAPGAALVNVARGAHVVDADLIEVLDEGRLTQATLDVFHDEPLPDGHPFWLHPKVHIFPHVAAPTDAASAARIAAENIRAFRRGTAIAGLVDRDRGY